MNRREAIVWLGMIVFVLFSSAQAVQAGARLAKPRHSSSLVGGLTARLLDYSADEDFMMAAISLDVVDEAMEDYAMVEELRPEAILALDSDSGEANTAGVNTEPTSTLTPTASPTKTRQAVAPSNTSTQAVATPASGVSPTSSGGIATPVPTATSIVDPVMTQVPTATVPNLLASATPSRTPSRTPTPADTATKTPTPVPTRTPTPVPTATRVPTPTLPVTVPTVTLLPPTNTPQPIPHGQDCLHNPNSSHCRTSIAETATALASGII